MSSFSDAWQKMLAQIEPAIDRGVQLAAEEVQKNVESSTLFKGSTGGLRSSIRILPNGMMARTVLADKDYAWYLEFGNDHHGPYIYPKGKALRFIANGSTFFATRVRSYAGRHFMQDAAKRSGPNVVRLIQAELIKVLS